MLNETALIYFLFHVFVSVLHLLNYLVIQARN